MPVAKYTKRAPRREKQQQTRKVRYRFHVHYLNKQKGGRLHDIATFRSACSPEGASAQLRVIQTLKSPEEGDDYIHVLKSAMNGQDLVVKIQEPGQMLNAELTVHSHLMGCNNIIRYVCDFSCLLDITWNKPLEAPRFLCDLHGVPRHIIIMEYINNDLANFLGGEHEIGNELFGSLVQQAGFAMLDFHINKHVCHGDINRGNILLHIDKDTKNLSYTICGRTNCVNTLGHEVIYIDFQRGHIVDDSETNSNSNMYSNTISISNSNATNKINKSAARDELSLLLQLMSKWTRNTEYTRQLHDAMRTIMVSKTVEDMLDCIESFGV